LICRRQSLKTKIIGKKIYYFKTLSSTNQYAKQLVKKNIDEGSIIVSDVQTMGRGRKSRTWYSPREGLWFSVVLYPNIPPQRGMLITMTTSVSVAQAIQEVTGLNPVIKWPNDLLIDGKKVCGILTELDAEMDKINYAAIGVGINVNNPLGGDLKNKAVSLMKKTGSKISRVKLLKSIIKHFDENYNMLNSGDTDSIRDLWFNYANIIGKRVRVEGEKSAVEGVVSGVDETGCLIIKTNGGNVQVVSGDLYYL
jgi:BirA family biotin operon repressor/biotin-[acetyl-CoA-carboxylase] ligase